MTDIQKRKVLQFQAYLSGRIIALTSEAKQSPGDAPACESAIAELQYIYDNIIPEMLKP